ncbi:uncharacterized protein EV422DRAFT_581551 [Fimicolochytrium jonesii]|uniref:uncharacterized protein n=1 Tax=Fimicolochytrium jonesii TaxID=1396493 RepID=UPI0022FEA89C|nr:uncharacterized protein EV422DRAFT_581551 [Fimicolochytrium jonesii]KAI8816330.1 hypothetical protein EV422DRAFT_581551 [Fimicolochytrium jonesii]
MSSVTDAAPGKGSKIPLRTSTKSNVKPVPDFSKLHQKWESKLESKLKNPKSTAATAARKDHLGRMETGGGVKPVVKKPIVPAARTTTKPAFSTSPLRQSKPAARPLHPPALDAPQPKPTVGGVIRTGLSGPARTALRKQPRKDPSDEFNNAALADILNSCDSNELDTKAGMGRGAARVETKRGTMGGARRVTTAVRRAGGGLGTLQEQVPVEELKRKSMYAGAIRVPKGKPQPATTTTDENLPRPPPISSDNIFNPSSKSNPSPPHHHQHPTRTPRPHRPAAMPAMTPRQQQNNKVARTMGILMAEAFGMTPGRSVVKSRRKGGGEASGLFTPGRVAWSEEAEEEESPSRPVRRREAGGVEEKASGADAADDGGRETATDDPATGTHQVNGPDTSAPPTTTLPPISTLLAVARTSPRAVSPSPGAPPAVVVHPEPTNPPAPGSEPHPKPTGPSPTPWRDIVGIAQPTNNPSQSPAHQPPGNTTTVRRRRASSSSLRRHRRSSVSSQGSARLRRELEGLECQERELRRRLEMISAGEGGEGEEGEWEWSEEGEEDQEQEGIVGEDAVGG